MLGSFLKIFICIKGIYANDERILQNPTILRFYYKVSVEKKHVNLHVNLLQTEYAICIIDSKE